MDIERLKELKAEFEKVRKYNVMRCMSTVTEDDVLELIDEAITNQPVAKSATSEDVAEAIKWTGDNLREVINLTGWNESASSKWTWEEYEQVVKEKGLKIFTPNGSVMADIGDWIVRDGNDCFVLQAYQPWIPVSERLPERPEYDWVLVHITLYPDGFVGLPHVAELRRGEWFSTEYDLPIEQILQGTVTHWKPLPEPPKGE